MTTAASMRKPLDPRQILNLKQLPYHSAGHHIWNGPAGVKRDHGPAVVCGQLTLLSAGTATVSYLPMLLGLVL